MPEQVFRGHHDERLAECLLHLFANEMEHLRRSRGIHDLHVVISAEREEAFETATRVLRTLTFVAVRQEHHESTRAFPLRFTTRNELINQYLTTVGKVTELRFPDDEHARIAKRIAIFEAEDSAFSGEL